MQPRRETEGLTDGKRNFHRVPRTARRYGNVELKNKRSPQTGLRLVPCRIDITNSAGRYSRLKIQSTLRRQPPQMFPNSVRPVSDRNFQLELTQPRLLSLPRVTAQHEYKTLRLYHLTTAPFSPLLIHIYNKSLAFAVIKQATVHVPFL